jgi:hypothetical protein
MLQKLLASALFLGVFVQVNSLECYNCTSVFDSNCVTVNKDTGRMNCEEFWNDTEAACMKVVIPIGNIGKNCSS